LADFVQFEGATKSATATLDKFDASGAKVSTQLVRMSDTSTRGAVSTTQWSGQLRQFDGILASMGVNISTETRALEDMERASGKSVAQLGKVATAGLVIGAGMAGWKIGRAVADFFDLDTKIAGATARLMGWGDLAGEVSGATQDAINRAFEKTGIMAKTAQEAFDLMTAALITNKTAVTDDTAALLELAATDKVFADIAAEYVRANEAIAQSAADAAEKLAGATERIAFDTKTLAEQLATIPPLLAEEATALLTAGAAAEDVAIKTTLTVRQVRALEEAMQGGTGAAHGYADSLERVAATKANDAVMEAISNRYGPQINYGPGGLTGGGGGYLGETAAETTARQANNNQTFQTVNPTNGGGGGNQINHINVTAQNPQEAARLITEEILRLQKLKGLMGAGGSV
jgi:hypothetical protein